MIKTTNITSAPINALSKKYETKTLRPYVSRKSRKTKNEYSVYTKRRCIYSTTQTNTIKTYTKPLKNNSGKADTK